jgi:hypothetical protein
VASFPYFEEAEGKPLLNGLGPTIIDLPMEGIKSRSIPLRIRLGCFMCVRPVTSTIFVNNRNSISHSIYPTIANIFCLEGLKNHVSFKQHTFKKTPRVACLQICRVRDRFLVRSSDHLFIPPNSNTQEISGSSALSQMPPYEATLSSQKDINWRTQQGKPMRSTPIPEFNGCPI